MVNYDDYSGRTDTITGGRGESKTVYVFHGTKDSDFDSRRLLLIVNLARSLEAHYGNVLLDFEFALDPSGKEHLFQVRRICAARNWNVAASRRVTGKLERVERFVRKRMAHAPASSAGAPSWATCRTGTRPRSSALPPGPWRPPSTPRSLAAGCGAWPGSAWDTRRCPPRSSW